MRNGRATNNGAGVIAVLGFQIVVASSCSPPPDTSTGAPSSVEDPAVKREVVLAAGQSLAAGEAHTCAVLEGGAVRCWGDNSKGQLGRATAGDQAQSDPLENGVTGAETFVNLGTGRTAKALTAGDFDTCAILDNDQIKCWGDNNLGQLGQGDTLPRGLDGTTLGDAFAGGGMGDALAPINLGTGRTAKVVEASGYHTCAILDTNQVKCWGQGEPGRLGYGDGLNRGSSPGQMGDFLPVVDLGTGRTAKALATTLHTTCVILDNNHVKCWGFNYYCSLGTDSIATPTRGYTPGTMGDNMPDLDIGAGRTATSIVAGRLFFCALRDDGSVKCWGDNTLGQVGINSPNTSWGCAPSEMGNAGIVSLGGTATAIMAGAEHACAMLSTGTVKCWGTNSNGTLGLGGQLGINTAPIPAELRSPSGAITVGATVRALVGGGRHTCAITTANKARCWGMNEFGQLGTNITAFAVGDAAGEMTTLVNSDLGTRKVTQVVAGGAHTCAILSGGAVKCWGANFSGALGVGDFNNRGDDPGEMGNSLPTLALGSGRTGKSLGLGGYFSCAVLDNNTVKCWGDNAQGQLGYGDTTTRSAPPSATVNLGSGLTAHTTAAFPLSGGSAHTCALLSNNQVKCWGFNAEGQLGVGDTTDRLSPPSTSINLGTGRTAKAVVSGNVHSCAILDNNTVKCWGANWNGQLGYGDTVNRTSPPATTVVNLGSGRTAKSIATFYDTTCAWLDNNTVKCWGANFNGQAGVGNSTNQLAPPSSSINLGSGHTALGIAAGSYHACAILATNQVKCWGANDVGQLGTWQDGSIGSDSVGDNGNEMGDYLPTVYQGGGRTVKALTAGIAHTCFLLDSNQVRCTGTNTLGELGQGNTDFYTPSAQGAGLVDLGVEP